MKAKDMTDHQLVAIVAMWAFMQSQANKSDRVEDYGDVVRELQLRLLNATGKGRVEILLEPTDYGAYDVLINGRVHSYGLPYSHAVDLSKRIQKALQASEVPE